MVSNANPLRSHHHAPNSLLRSRPLPPAGGAGGLHHGLAGRRRYAAGLPPTGGGRRPPGHRRRLRVCAGGVVGVLGTGVRVPSGSGTIAGGWTPPLPK